MKELGEISTDLPPTQHFTSHLLEYNRPLVGWKGTGLGVPLAYYLSEFTIHPIEVFSRFRLLTCCEHTSSIYTITI